MSAIDIKYSLKCFLESSEKLSYVCEQLVEPLNL